ncbi:hypothetical protein TWF281_008433 [Arthrobotrys megalospora]
MKPSLRNPKLQLGPSSYFGAGALTAAPIVWSSTRNISASAVTDKLSSIKHSVLSWIPSPRPSEQDDHTIPTLELPASPSSSSSSRSTYQTDTVVNSTTAGLRSTFSSSVPLQSLPLHPASPKNIFSSIMDDFIVQAYPYAKLAAGHAKVLLSHVLKAVYPILNHLYNQNPTLVSIVLLISAVYFVLRIVTRITNFIWSVTRNIFQFFFVAGVILACMNYYNKRAAGKLGDDGTLIPGFDWDATWADFQGVWGFVQNVGGMLMDLVESGSHLEEDGWNSGRRKTMGKKGDPLFADQSGGRGKGAGGQKWR